MKIIQVDNISLFNDFGDKNDVYVQGMLKQKGVGKDAQIQVVKTDTHKCARSVASFCQVWVLHITCPISTCSMTLELMDEDKFLGASLIYGAKHLPLDPFIQRAHRNHLYGDPQPGKLLHEVIFDSYPPGHPRESTGCWGKCCKRRQRGPKPATLSLEIEILTNEQAAKAPMQHNFVYAEPHSRMDWKFISVRPAEYAYNMIGPRIYGKIRRYCICSIIVFVLLIFLAIFYLIAQTFVAPFM